MSWWQVPFNNQSFRLQLYNGPGRQTWVHRANKGALPTANFFVGQCRKTNKSWHRIVCSVLQYMPYIYSLVTYPQCISLLNTDIEYLIGYLIKLKQGGPFTTGGSWATSTSKRRYIHRCTVPQQAAYRLHLQVCSHAADLLLAAKTSPFRYLRRCLYTLSSHYSMCVFAADPYFS